MNTGETRIEYLADHPTYVEKVARLKYAHWRQTSPDRPHKVWVDEIRHSARKGELPLTFIALESGELLGFVTLVEIPEKAGIEKGVWLITLYVREGHRGVGFGARLAQRCLIEARRMGYKAVQLWTESAGLTDYYRRQGWRVVTRDGVSGEDIMMVVLDDVSDSNGARGGGS